jgi:DNA-binding PadR family transcriptional regulator
VKEMTARELYNTTEAGQETLEDFLAVLTSALMDEGGVDFVSFPDSDVDEEILEEINWGL